MENKKIVLSTSLCYALGRADYIAKRVASQVMGVAGEVEVLHTDIDPGEVKSVSSDPMDRIIMATRAMEVKPNDLYRTIRFKMDVCRSDIEVPRVSHTIEFALHLRAKMPERIWRIDEISPITASDQASGGKETFLANSVEPRCLIEHEHAPGQCVYPGEKYMLYRS